MTRDWDAYIEYNRQDVNFMIRLAELSRAQTIAICKERYGIFWRIGLWLMDHHWISGPFDGTK